MKKAEGSVTIKRDLKLKAKSSNMKGICEWNGGGEECGLFTVSSDCRL